VSQLQANNTGHGASYVNSLFIKVFIQRGSPASLGCRLINSGWGVSDVTGVPPQLGICLFIAVLESKVVYMRS